MKLILKVVYVGVIMYLVVAALFVGAVMLKGT